ncbi:hypothetical protein WSM22_34580 [Cytophagales bacterium WSM2-2]|nr:hypothetical protein WSM22_34580 [Cytophagales bacterium WSM2-2]
MRHLKHPERDQLKGIHHKIEDALKKLKDPTQESAEKTIHALLGSRSNDTSSLVLFTGYYSMNTAPHAFLSIDTTELYVTYVLSQKITISIHIPAITVNVSMDGITSTPHTFDSSCSFDGRNLVIPNVLQLVLTRVYNSGQLVTFSGTITDKGKSTAVSGSTYFNPVELPVFVGDYKEAKQGVKNPKTILKVAKGSLKFDFGTGLENISIFTYTPAMYVVLFEHPAGTLYTLMLGTDSEHGLACFITDGKTNDFAVTIP